MTINQTQLPQKGTPTYNNLFSAEHILKLQKRAEEQHGRATLELMGAYVGLTPWQMWQQCEAAGLPTNQISPSRNALAEEIAAFSQGSKTVEELFEVFGRHFSGIGGLYMFLRGRKIAFKGKQPGRDLIRVIHQGGYDVSTLTLSEIHEMFATSYKSMNGLACLLRTHGIAFKVAPRTKAKAKACHQVTASGTACV